MATSILMSGFDKGGFFETVSTELRKSIADTSTLLFVASTPDDFEKIDEYTQRIFRYFSESGICFDKYKVLDKRMPDGQQQNAITDASCIFLMGGYARVQLAYLKEQKLIDLLRVHQGVIMGLSAGAINMAKRSVIANPNHPPTSVYEGMDLVAVTVVPHFDSNKHEFIQTEILPLTYDGTIYGLCDDGIIAIEGDTVRHRGTIYELKQGSIRLLADGEPMC